MLLVDNLSFLFLHLLFTDLLPHTVAESLSVRIFCGIISINCGQFYSVGLPAPSSLTTNCSASNPVWGLPAGGPAEWMEGSMCRGKATFFPAVRYQMQSLNWSCTIIDVALQARCGRLFVQFPGSTKKKKKKALFSESTAVFKSGINDYKKV